MEEEKQKAAGECMSTAQLIKTAIDDLDLDLIIKEAAAEQMKKTVQQKVEELFQSYGYFGKKIGDHIKSTLCFDPSAIKIQNYQDFFIDQVNTQLATLQTPELASKIRDSINMEVIGENRSEIELYDFLNEVQKLVLGGIDEYDEHGIELVINKETRSTFSSDYYDLTVSIDSKKTAKASFSGEGRIYHVRFEDYELCQLKAWFQALKYRKTKITGMKEVDLELSNRDY